MIEIIKAMSELGAGTRGASLGYDALWVAAHGAGKPEILERLKTSVIEPFNQHIRPDHGHPHAIHIPHIAKYFQKIITHLGKVALSQYFPLVISGDHSSAGAIIQGLIKAHPNKKLGVIWIDAHADIHSPFTSPSGNMHGMPVSTILGISDSRYQRDERSVLPETKALWKQMCLSSDQALSPSQMVYFGVRDTEIDEDTLIEEMEIKNFTVEECRLLGIKTAANKAIEQLENCDHIYISFDVDSLDCSFANGTGTPVINGFSEVEVSKLLHYLFQTKKVSCFEITEINPTLDKEGNATAELAFSILSQVVDMVNQHS